MQALDGQELPPRCPIALIDGKVHLRMLRSQKWLNEEINMHALKEDGYFSHCSVAEATLYSVISL